MQVQGAEAFVYTTFISGRQVARVHICHSTPWPAESIFGPWSALQVFPDVMLQGQAIRLGSEIEEILFRNVANTWPGQPVLFLVLSRCVCVCVCVCLCVSCLWCAYVQVL